MKKVFIIAMLSVLALCFCSCDDNTMSHEEYEKYSSIEEELSQYHHLDEYHILTEDGQEDFYKALEEQYGEDIAENVIDMFYTNTHELGGYID